MESELSWHEREQRDIERQKEAVESFKRQCALFKEKFGREPGPDDPVYFDPDHPTPRPFDYQKLKAMMIAQLRKSKWPPEIIFAFDRMDRMLTEEDAHLWSDGDLAKWDNAIDDYFRLQALIDDCENPQPDSGNDEP